MTVPFFFPIVNSGNFDILLEKNRQLFNHKIEKEKTLEMFRRNKEPRKFILGSSQWEMFDLKKIKKIPKIFH